MLEGCTPYPPEFATRYVGEGIWRAETITQAIANAARKTADATAVRDAARSLTFAQLIDEAGRIAAVLSSAGIAAGDRIVVQVPNCVDFATLFLACLEVGAIPIMALPAFREAELEYLVSFSGAKAIAIAPEYRGFDYARMARELKTRFPSLTSIFVTAPCDGCVHIHSGSLTPSRIGTSNRDPFDVALFLLSGGTTGIPKLIPRTHTDYLYNAREAAALCGLTSDSRILIALPAEHNFPLACPGLLGALLTGAQTVFTASTQASDLAATIAREKITHIACVPTLAMTLLDLPQSQRRDLASLRVITVGGQRLQPHTARALRRIFPQITVQQVLGMAEGLLCYTRLTDSDEVACTTQGRPMSAADEIRIVNADGSEAADGESGELWCRGPYTIRGYFRSPERNLEAFTPTGFYRTGDLVRRGAAGNLVVEGRIKDLINRGGEKISAEEVEAHLIAHPAVSAAAVVSMPDTMLGEKACAYLILKPAGHFELIAMREFLAVRGVAKFKWPERIEIVNALPLTNVGKVKKADLRRDIEQKLMAERESACGAEIEPTGNTHR